MNSPGECTICTELLTGRIQICSCTHKFHKDCLNEWKQNHSTCPNCRHDISDDLETPDPPPVPSDEWHQEFSEQHIKALFKIFNGTNIPATPEIIEEFVNHNKLILKVLADKEADPVISCNKIIREEVIRFQALRLKIKKLEDEAERDENDTLVNNIILRNTVLNQQRRIEELESGSSKGFFGRLFRSSRVRPS